MERRISIQPAIDRAPMTRHRPSGRSLVWLGLAIFLAGLSQSTATAESVGPLAQALKKMRSHHALHGPKTSAIFEHELRQGEQAFAVGDYLKAALYHARAVRESPRHPLANLWLGLGLLGLERFDQAVVALERALLLSDRWHSLPIDLRKAYGKQFARIVSALEKWRGEPANQQAGQFLAILIGRYSGQFEQAKSGLELLRKKWPKAVTRHRAISQLFEGLGGDNSAGGTSRRDPYVRGVYLFYNARYTEAADAFSEAYVADTSFLMGALFMAHALFASGKQQLAAQIVVRTVRRDPGKVARRIELLREFYKEPDLLDKQIAALKQRLKQAPWPEGFFLLAYLYYADGEYPAASALFGKLGESLGERRKSLRSLSKQMVVWTRKQIRGEIPRRAARPPVKPPQSSAIKKKPQPPGAAAKAKVDPEELLESCALHLKKGEYARAKQRIEQFFSAHKATGLAYFLRARVHLAVGEYVYGGIAVRNGLALSGEASRIRFDWTRFYPSRKAFEGHRKKLDRYVDDEPEKPNARFLAGFIHYYLGGYDRALSLFKRNLWLDPNDRHSRIYIELITQQLQKDDDKE